MTCYLNIAGLSVSVQTPWTVQVSDRFRPFVKNAMHGVADSTVTVHIENTLPTPASDAVWHGPFCMDQYAGLRRTFHTDANRVMQVLTTVNAHGNVDMAVTPPCADKLRDLSGIFNYLGFENWLLQHGGLLLHASLIQYHNNGIAFAGPSGVGKSTQANLWHQTAGAVILNGDRAVLRKTDQGWIAFGSPFAGTSGIYTAEGVKLDAVVLLHQADKNELYTVTGGAAIQKLYPELSIHRFDGQFVEQAVDLLVDLVEHVAIRQLSCLPNTHAVQVLKEGLSL